MPKATTVRFTDEMFGRLDQASARTGMPVNSIVIAACLEWMERHTPAPGKSRIDVEPTTYLQRLTVPPRWATLRRAVEVAVGKGASSGMYPFERFTSKAKSFLTLSQTEALTAGYSYIGTEHMLLAAFGDPDFQSAKVLAALGVEEEGIAAHVLKDLGATRERIESEMAQLTEPEA